MITARDINDWATQNEAVSKFREFGGRNVRELDLSLQRRQSIKSKAGALVQIFFYIPFILCAYFQWSFYKNAALVIAFCALIIVLWQLVGIFNNFRSMRKGEETRIKNLKNEVIRGKENLALKFKLFTKRIEAYAIITVQISLILCALLMYFPIINNDLFNANPKELLTIMFVSLFLCFMIIVFSPNYFYGPHKLTPFIISSILSIVVILTAIIYFWLRGFFPSFEVIKAYFDNSKEVPNAVILIVNFLVSIGAVFSEIIKFLIEKLYSFTKWIIAYNKALFAAEEENMKRVLIDFIRMEDKCMELIGMPEKSHNTEVAEQILDIKSDDEIEISGILFRRVALLEIFARTYSILEFRTHHKGDLIIEINKDTKFPTFSLVTDMADANLVLCEFLEPTKCSTRLA